MLRFPKRTATAANLVLCLIITLMLGSPSRAMQLDKSFADRGTPVPTSRRVGDIPAFWEMWNLPAVTNDVIDVWSPSDLESFRPTNLAEPANGNPNPTTLGHVLPLAGFHAVYDRLAIWAVPHFLHFTTGGSGGGLVYDSPMPSRADPLITGFVGGAAGGGGGSGSRTGGGIASATRLPPNFDPPPVIPDPATIAIATVGVAAVVSGRRRVRSAE